MSSDSIRQIKERLTIVDVVAPYVELHQAGKNLKGKSPFTNERTPSFYVSPDRGMYYCFSSNQGGDIFTFIEKMEGVEFKDALKILADKAGVELVPEDPKKKTERDRMHDALEDATKFFEAYRYKNPEVLKYLTDRGVTAETIAKWRIGYAPGPPQHGWRELKDDLEKKGYKKDELLKVGLIKGADGGKEPYDLFRDRIMFPIFDVASKVVAYSGRILTKDSESPKYVNSPETELFNKSEILYGYDKAKQGIRNLDFTLVVEGQFDVVLSHQAGYTNTVAVSGTALTAHHVMLLQRLSNRVVLALDADRAGIAAVKRAADLMLPRGMDVKVASMIGGKDPADMVHEDVHKFRKIVGGAKPVVEYFLDILESQKKDERSYKLLVREEILPLLVKISNKIDQEHFEGVIAERLGTTKDAIHFEIERLLENKSLQRRAEEKSVASASSTPSKTPYTKEDYTEYFFAVLQFLHGFNTQVKVVQIFEEKLREILGEAYENIKSEMTLERLNKEVMDLEKNHKEFPSKMFFEDLASKLSHYYRRRIDEKKTALRVRQRELDELGKSNGEEYDALITQADILNKESSKAHISPAIFLDEMS